MSTKEVVSLKDMPPCPLCQRPLTSLEWYHGEAPDGTGFRAGKSIAWTCYGGCEAKVCSPQALERYAYYFGVGLKKGQ